MAAYTIALQRDIKQTPELAQYRDKVQETLVPFGGRFLARGGNSEVWEGSLSPERVVIIEFPDLERARAWYRSPEYQAIIEGRTRNAYTNMVVVEGVRPAL